MARKGEIQRQGWTFRLGWGLLLALAVQALAASDLWPERSRAVLVLAGEFQVPVEQAEGERALTLALDPQEVFDARGETIRPAWLGFLRGLASQFQPGSGFRLVITGYGDRPAKGYNPVLLGKRVRALQTFLAENGLAMTWSRAEVREGDAYEGPAEMLDEACCGKVITLKLVVS